MHFEINVIIFLTNMGIDLLFLLRIIGIIWIIIVVLILSAKLMSTLVSKIIGKFTMKTNMRGTSQKIKISNSTNAKQIQENFDILKNSNYIIEFGNEKYSSDIENLNEIEIVSKTVYFLLKSAINENMKIFIDLKYYKNDENSAINKGKIAYYNKFVNILKAENSPNILEIKLQIF